MGVCTLEDDKNRRILHKEQKELSIDGINPATDLSNDSPKKQNLYITNRISKRTKIANINNDYTITDIILGKGATGIVREGLDKNGGKYAIKTVWKSDIEKNEFFKKEIDISLELNHESIVKCIEVYEDNSSLHFVLEEINGGDLFDHIIHSEGRKLTEAESIDLLIQILEGLHYLHVELGIVHRDIKPENFLLFNDGHRIKIKLIDFGFATYCKGNETMHEQLGTPQYAAPEIFEQKPYNSKVDMWSVGVVLYNMVKGTQPFSNREIENIKEQVLHKEINYSGFKNNELKNLCESLLDRNPENRFSAFQALQQIKMIKTGDRNEDTLVVAFKPPNIHNFMSVLYNDATLKLELRNIYLTECNSEQVNNMFKEISKVNDYEKNKDPNILEMVSEKLYMKVEKLIEYTINSKYAPENLKKRLKNYCEQKVIEKMKKQMIDVDNFFATVIEGIKNMRKTRIQNEFEKLDKNNFGWIDKDQLKNFFIDPMKRHNIKTKLDRDDKIDFDTFYKIFNEYNGIKHFI